MRQETDRKPAALLDGWPKAAQWTGLLVLSAALAGALEFLGIPAGFLLGPMIVGIAAGTGGASVRIAKKPYMLAQAVVGCLVANSVTPGIIVTFLDDWPLFVALVSAVIAASSTLGWLMSRWQVLPGSTAVCGRLARRRDGDDADGRSFRRGCPAGGVHAICTCGDGRRRGVRHLAHLGRGVRRPGATPDLLAPVDWPAFAETILLVVAGSSIGAVSRIPAGPLPRAAGRRRGLHALGIAAFALPVWLLAPCYALIGWRVGLSFTRDVLRMPRAMPAACRFGSILLLAFCGGLAFVLNRAVGIDPLSAYLATSPAAWTPSPSSALEPRRPALRHDAADRALRHGAHHRTGLRALPGPARQLRRTGDVTLGRVRGKRARRRGVWSPPLVSPRSQPTISVSENQ